MLVVKRDGREVEVDTKLIYNAVCKAAKATGMLDQDAHNCAEVIRTKVVSHLKGDKVSVEEIQDCVERNLMQSKWKNVAKAYVSYRHDRDLARTGKSKLFADIETFLDGSSEEYTRENSNKQTDQIVTHRDLIAGIVSKHLAASALPADIQKLNEEGGLHTHDKDYFISKGIHNCGVYDFETMLRDGVKLGDIEVETPKSIGTAANVACQIFSKISGSSYGGQSMHEFDEVMKPYAEKTLAKIKAMAKERGTDEKYIEADLRKEVYDACQTFIYQIQTVTSPNGQASFSTISLSLSQNWMNKLIKEEYLKCHINGIGPQHRSPIFPKVLYFVEEGINLNEWDPNYDEFQLALKCSSKHMYPDYIMAPANREMTGCTNKVTTAMGR